MLHNSWKGTNSRLLTSVQLEHKVSAQEPRPAQKTFHRYTRALGIAGSVREDLTGIEQLSYQPKASHFRRSARTHSEHFLNDHNASVAALRCCHVLSRSPIRPPSGRALTFTGIRSVPMLRGYR